MSAASPYSANSLTPTVPALSRNAAVVLSIVLLHVGVLYALYSGLLNRAVEAVVPNVVMAQLIEPPKPKEMAPTPSTPQALPAPPKPFPPLPRPPPQPARKPVSKVPQAPPVTAPLLAAIADPKQAANAPTAVTAPQLAPVHVAAPVAAAQPSLPAPELAPATGAVKLPSSDADYLKNPLPPYPPISRRLNEQGTSLLSVFIGADGVPQRAELVKSSGFERLDKAALATAMRWRYVPGKRGGVAEPMSVTVPIVWELN